RIVRNVRVSALEESVELLKSAPQRMVADILAPQVPFSNRSSSVSHGAHPIRESCLAQRQPLLLRVAARSQKVRRTVRVEFMAKSLLVASRHQSCARGTAVRRRNIRLRETRAVAGQRVDMRSRNIRTPVNAEIAIAQIVGQNDDDVRLPRACALVCSQGAQ